MKALQKLKLKSKVDVLTNSDLKQIVGGYDVTSPAEFVCTCHGAANPSRPKTWTKVYNESQDMSADIALNCSDGGQCLPA